VVRHRQIDFAGGALVFPGGKVDAADGDPALRARIDAPAGLAAADLALRVAGVRETFEEAGVLLAREQDSGNFPDAARMAALGSRHRDALHDGATTIGAIAAAEGLRLACDRLVPFAHWITPHGQRRRFDTHFFVIEAPGGDAAVHDGGESVDSLWIRPAEALAAAEAGQRTIVFPTRLNLGKLARSDTTAAAIATARATPVVRVLPKVKTVAGGRIIRIPREADYGGEEFHVAYSAA